MVPATFSVNKLDDFQSAHSGCLDTGSNEPTISDVRQVVKMSFSLKNDSDDTHNSDHDISVYVVSQNQHINNAL